MAGQWEAAQLLHDRYIGLFEAMFVDTNPIPVKAALAMMGKIEEVYRLPLCSMDETLKDTLREVLAGLELL